MYLNKWTRMFNFLRLHFVVRLRHVVVVMIAINHFTLRDTCSYQDASCPAPLFPPFVQIFWAYLRIHSTEPKYQVSCSCLLFGDLQRGNTRSARPWQQGQTGLERASRKGGLRGRAEYAQGDHCQRLSGEWHMYHAFFIRKKTSLEIYSI